MFFRIGTVISSIIFLATYLSPQLGFYGRGLRVGLPMFCLAVLFSGISDIGAVLRVLRRFRWIFILGSLFALFAFMRFMTIGSLGYDVDAVASTYVYSVIQVVMAVFLILLVREFGKGYLNGLCHGVFWFAAISLCLGIPVLIAQPGVAREVMRMGLLGFSRLEDRSGEGVGTYTQYTAIAVAFFPLLVWLAESRGLWRILCVGMLLGLATAVLVSTFTMAAAILVIASLCGVAYWVCQNKVMAVPRFAIVTAVVFASSGAVVASASQSKAFSFVYDKASLLWERIGTTGLVEGDRTGRGAMFVQDWHTFLDNPILGPIGGVTAVDLGTGHSSLMNTLAVNGLPCAAIWFATLYLLARETARPVTSWRLRWAIWGSWTMFFASGILNPTWHFPSVTATVFLYLLVLSPEKETQSGGSVVDVYGQWSLDRQALSYAQ